LAAYIAASARRRLHRRAWAYIVLRRISWSAAAAAVMVAMIALPLRDRDATTSRVSHAAREDVNADGHIDIRDALILARRIEAGQRVEAHWDFTGDRIVDRKDVDAVALVAVRLDRGGL